jgi:hypothetical protein
MNKVLNETLEKAYRPYDIVSDNKGNVGFIKEVNVNDCQPEAENQINYAVEWLTGDNKKVAWFEHNELIKHCNLFVKIAEASCHPMGHSERWVEKALFKNL